MMAWGLAWALLAGGCSTPLLYPPYGDSAAVVDLPLPTLITTLAGLPRTSTSFDRQVDRPGMRTQADLLEMFSLRQGPDANQVMTEYAFNLRTDLAAAHREYEFYKGVFTRSAPVFEEIERNGNRSCLCYTWQPRSAEMPVLNASGEYVSYAVFQLRNLVVTVSVHESGSHKRGPMEQATARLITMLRAAVPPP